MATEPPAPPPPHTGLVCPQCRLPVGVIESHLPRLTMSKCPACGHRWAIAAHPEDAPPHAAPQAGGHRRWGRIGISVGLLVVAVIAGGVFGQAALRRLVPPAARAITLEMLEQTATDLNRGLPRMVNPTTELTNVRASARLLTYNHRLVSLRAEDVESSFVEALRPELLASTCSAPGLRDSFLSAGVTLRWAYYDRDSRYVAVIDVTPRDCGF